MGAHEFHGQAPSRHGRKLSKLGPGIIEAARLDELLHPTVLPGWVCPEGEHDHAVCRRMHDAWKREGERRVDEGGEGMREALIRVLDALDRCESNRGRFSTVAVHDNRCPKSRADSPEKWRGVWRCECGSEELDAAVEAARLLTGETA